MAILKENFLKIRNVQSLNEIDDLLNFILNLLNIKSLEDDFNDHQKNMAFIYKFIVDKFAFLTTEEVKEAFRMYVAKEFDIKVFRILDCVLIGDVLTSYIERRAEVLASYTPTDNKPKLEAMTISAKEEINKQAVNRVYLEFKQEKSLPDGLGYIYDILVDHGKIKLANENTPKLQNYYNSKMTIAKNQLSIEKKSELRKESSKFNIAGVNAVKEALLKIESGNSNEVVSRVKKLVLTDYFNNCILDNVEVILN